MEPIEQARKIIRGSGVHDPDQYIIFDDEIPMKIKKYNNWIEDCINKKNGKLHSLEH